MENDIKIEKPWGHEIIWAKTDNYLGKVLFIEEGKKTSLQFHNEKSESIRVEKGVLLLTIGTKRFILRKEMSFDIPKKTIHRMQALTNCWVYEVSTNQIDDVVRIEDEYGRA
ncbi:MAG: cupin [Verrucomicrobiales bacterium]|nr:cupin [Verrucomicrobiales bacterium]|tara:strand:+ start:985 stop:1320 length:336 start_codon:yes stop_codon:yes gene_type:complete